MEDLKKIVKILNIPWGKWERMLKKCHSSPSEVIADNSIVDQDCKSYMIVPGFKN